MSAQTGWARTTGLGAEGRQAAATDAGTHLAWAAQIRRLQCAVNNGALAVSTGLAGAGSPAAVMAAGTKSA